MSIFKKSKPKSKISVSRSEVEPTMEAIKDAIIRAYVKSKNQ